MPDVVNSTVDCQG